MIIILPLRSSLVAYEGRVGGWGAAWRIVLVATFPRGFCPKLRDLLKPYHLALKTLL